MSDINILELLRSKKNTTLSIITTHRSTDSYNCTSVLDGDAPKSGIISKPEYLFAELDNLLTRDDVTYQVTILPRLSLVINTREEEISISSTMLYSSDIFETNSCNVVVNTPSKILANIIEREIVPVKIQVQYQNISGRITITATDSKDTTVYPNTPEPMPWLKVQQSTEPVPFTDTKEVKAKGYTNVIVGHEDVSDPIEHRNRLTAEVMQHIANVTSGNVHESIPTQVQPDIHIGAVNEEEVKRYRERIFNEGLQELAKESKRRAEQPATSTEDDFAI